MQHQLFGSRTGLKVSSIALGTGLFGKLGGYGSEPDDVPRMLQAYVEAGGNFIDISDAYQHGASEERVGKFIAGRRDGMVIVSKFGRTARADPELAATGNSRKVMVQSVEASLRRLKTERIDLYLAHLDDSVTPMQELVRGLDDLIRAGKIVYGGLSNFPAWRMALGVAASEQLASLGVIAAQVEYSLLARDAEREILPMANALGLGVMGYSPLASGVLTGKYRRSEGGSAAAKKPGMRHDAAAHNETVDAVTAIADELETNPGAVAIAWSQSRGIVPIIGPRTPAQLVANLEATTLSLSDEQIKRLNDISATPRGYPHDLLAPVQQSMLGDIKMPNCSPH